MQYGVFKRTLGDQLQSGISAVGGEEEEGLSVCGGVTEGLSVFVPLVDPHP